MKTVSLGSLHHAGRRAALPVIAIAAAAAAAPTQAQNQALSCQTAARVEVTTVGTNPRYLSFRIYNQHDGALSVKITIGKVEEPWIATNPLLDHYLYKGRSVAYAFAQTSSPTAGLPPYVPVYDMAADPAALQIGVQNCVGS